jgi:hypothetical protein
MKVFSPKILGIILFNRQENMPTKQGLREEGGLGVVDFVLQNTCLLLKVVHGLMSRRDTP